MNRTSASTAIPLIHSGARSPRTWAIRPPASAPTNAPVIDRVRFAALTGMSKDHYVGEVDVGGSGPLANSHLNCRREAEVE